ncbi:flagellar protein FlgN [Marinobacterium sp. AK62]|uniref:Flagellar protein FlgN n=1 Tax=Marinobacterium alkalitolerans TaxID=1542925 RepID=A0ABS3ZA34_9GAMM|nr:flagellar protein FlgN [Marinobacterium alkalitolerans]MBP0048563.1 flagellar protein FlgN [Marinobacterium alkalitolerans]
MSVDAPTPEYSAQLGSLIDKSRQLLEQLVPLLDKELDALKTRDIDALTENNELKQKILLELDGVTRALNEQLQQFSVAPDTDSVLAFFARLPGPANKLLTRAWQSLESQLDHVKQLNLRNEQVILRSKQNTDQLLAILQGHARSNTVYNPQGGEGRYEGQRSLGKA